MCILNVWIESDEVVVVIAINAKRGGSDVHKPADRVSKDWTGDRSRPYRAGVSKCHLLEFRLQAAEKCERSPGNEGRGFGSRVLAWLNRERRLL